MFKREHQVRTLNSHAHDSERNETLCASFGGLVRVCTRVLRKWKLDFWLEGCDGEPLCATKTQTVWQCRAATIKVFVTAP